VAAWLGLPERYARQITVFPRLRHPRPYVWSPDVASAPVFDSAYHALPVNAAEFIAAVRSALGAPPLVELEHAAAHPYVAPTLLRARGTGGLLIDSELSLHPPGGPRPPVFAALRRGKPGAGSPCAERPGHLEDVETTIRPLISLHVLNYQPGAVVDGLRLRLHVPELQSAAGGRLISMEAPDEPLIPLQRSAAGVELVLPSFRIHAGVLFEV
jgi:hypothetical protein